MEVVLVLKWSRNVLRNLLPYLGVVCHFQRKRASRILASVEVFKQFVTEVFAYDKLGKPACIFLVQSCSRLESMNHILLML